MRALALDVGSKTIGLALSDTDRMIATAGHTLARRGHVDDAREVARVVAEREVGLVVVGLPFELDGREGRRARAVRAFIAVLREHFTTTGVAVELTTWDERFSTAAAERTLIEADMSRARRKQHIDAMAAQFILQGWLDAQRPEPRR
ncbi:MAG: Holliday junction resolvase RuvX [Myxococcales bacterium]|jgi:putative Holliday junction resolvase|nr:Holliday junction resolvase RuvX [Myxococcales bacterium]